MKYFILSLFIVTITTTQAQDVFQKELFSIEQIQKYKDEIDLTDQQLKAIRKIYNDNIGTYNNLKWDLDAEYAKMKDELAKAKLDSETSMAQMSKVLSIETELKKQRLSTMIGIRNSLTAEQQQQLKKLVNDNSFFPTGVITPINENPRVSLKVDGKKNAQPIFIVIGKNGPKIRKDASKLNPDTIESISVIKGEKATDMFGPSGDNGVIVINLKGSKKVEMEKLKPLVEEN